MPASASSAALRGRAYWTVHGAVLLFGLAGVLGKLTLLPPTTIVLGRVLFGGLSLGALLGARRQLRTPRNARELGVLALSGVLLAIHWTAFFQSIQVSTVAIALLSFSTFPLFTAVLETLLLHEPPRRLEVLAALLVIPGVFLIVPTPSLANSTTQGVLWGLGAGATFALLSIWNRRLTRQYASPLIGFYQESAATLLLLPTLLFVRPAKPFTMRDVLVLAILGIICTALAHTLFIEGMRTLTAQTASIIAALEPVWGIVIAFVLLHEVPAVRTVVGGICILAATLVPWLRPPPPPSNSTTRLAAPCSAGVPRSADGSEPQRPSSESATTIVTG